MARRSSHAFDELVERLAVIIANRIGASLPKGTVGSSARTSKLRGRKLDMRCRYPSCKNKSEGPHLFRRYSEPALQLSRDPKQKAACLDRVCKHVEQLQGIS